MHSPSRVYYDFYGIKTLIMKTISILMLSILTNFKMPHGIKTISTMMFSIHIHLKMTLIVIKLRIMMFCTLAML